MTSPAQWCSPDDTLESAAELMWAHDCGCLPVCISNGSVEPIGVVTDRDICMCALFNDKQLSKLSVAEAMAKSVLACRTGDSLDEAEKIMRDSHVRRLPVVDQNRALIGMISLADLAREANREQRLAQREITDADVCDTLAAICEPGRTLIA
jgi:CBS domain-containing protein